MQAPHGVSSAQGYAALKFARSAMSSMRSWKPIRDGASGNTLGACEPWGMAGITNACIVSIGNEA